jgi:hypothetical protein
MKQSEIKEMRKEIRNLRIRQHCEDNTLTHCMETQKCILFDIHVTVNNITLLSVDKGRTTME